MYRLQTAPLLTKLVCLLSCLCVPVLAVSVQGQEVQGELDSLHRLVLQLDKAEVPAAEVYALLGQYHAQANPDSGVYYFEQAKRIYARADRPADAYATNAELSRVCLEAGRYPQAKSYAREAYIHATAMADPGEQALALQLLALVQRRELDYARATETTLRAIELVQRSAPTRVDLLTKLYIGLGRIFGEQGDDAAAIKAYETAFSIANLNKTKVARMDRGMALYFLGTIYMGNGNVDKAEKVMDLYRRFAEEREDYSSVYSQGNHGPIAMFMRDTALATKHYRNAYLQAIAENNSKRVAIATCNLAQLALDNQQFDEALLLGHETLSYAGDDLESVDIILPIMAKAHVGEGQLDSGTYYLKLLTKLHDSHGGFASRERLAALAAEFAELQEEAHTNLLAQQSPHGTRPWMIGVSVLLLVGGLTWKFALS